ncbi:Helix-turn-helix domain protein [compost metagenome]
MTLGCNRVGKVIDLSHLREISLRIKGAVNMMQAARLLHISTVRVRQLVAAGIIRVFGGEPRHGESWLIDGNSIADLSIESIISGAEKDLVTVSYLAKHHLPAGGGLVELIQAIRSGEIRAYRGADDGHSTLGYWLVKPQDLTGWLHTSFHGKSSEFPGVSVGKAAVLLGLKEEVAYSFVRLGLLWSTSVKRGRCTQQMVKPDAIERFRRRYILGPEIAVYLGMSPRDSLKHLWEIRIRPIAGPTISTASCRQYVWARSKKLVDYLAWKAAHSEDLDVA